MVNAERLSLTERSSVDLDRLRDLAEEMGPAAAERYLGRSIEEIANWTTLAWAAYHDGDAGGLARAVREVRKVALAIGLCSLARVARDVAQTVEDGDGAATAATLARMSRIAEGIHYAICDGWAATM